jgi:hypothetical protein
MSSKLLYILNTFRSKAAHPPAVVKTLTGFGLISLRPHLSFDRRGMPFADFNKRFQFPAEIKHVAQANIDSAVWGHEKYGCADDICMLAHIMSRSMEVKAAGSERTIKAALLEASRYTEADRVKYIVFHYKIQAAKGKNAIVLENLVAPHDADEAIVVTLDRSLEDMATSDPTLLLA